MGLQQTSIESLPFVTAELNYLAPTPGKPRTYAFDPPPGEPKSTALPEPHNVPIFDARLIAIIRRNHPEQAAKMDFATVVGAFHRQAAKAQRYGLTDEHSAATYVYTAWLMGEEFDTRIPAVAQILADKRMKAAEKAKALGNFSRLVFRTLSGGAANEAPRSAA